MSVAFMKSTMPAAEFRKWMLYFQDKPADVAEVQMALLITTVNNALGGKGKFKDFILSGSNGKSEVPHEMSPDAVAMAMRSML